MHQVLDFYRVVLDGLERFPKRLEDAAAARVGTVSEVDLKREVLSGG